MSTYRYFIQLAYKGTHYCGWQKQPNGIAVQQKLEEALHIICRDTTIETTGCGRTDTGVHATDFYVHVDLKDSINDVEQFIYKLNALTPKDIAIKNVVRVKEEAHARFDAFHREYKYYIHFNKDPFLQETSVYLNKLPNLELMNKAAKLLLSISDFTSFAKLHGDSKTNICEVKEAFWVASDNGMVFTISANRFLRNMVRAVVGTLLEVGFEKISLDQFKQVIEAKNRSQAGVSVPAHGLFLTAIKYPYPII